MLLQGLLPVVNTAWHSWLQTDIKKKLILKKILKLILKKVQKYQFKLENCCVLQCPLDEQGEKANPLAGIRVSQLSLIDLAGSERTSRTKAAGLRIKEAGNINNTLMMLRSCIEILRENQLTNSNRMVPYRGSKITHYLKNYFDGDGKVKMVICVNPLASDYDETLVSCCFVMKLSLNSYISTFQIIEKITNCTEIGKLSLS